MTRLTSTDVIRISSSGNGNGSPLDRLRQNYDLVIIDSPPMEHNRANPFFPLAGAVILVVEAEKTKHQIVRRSKEQIERQGGNLIGIVLNKKRFHVPDWLYNRL
jgi:Mrp family chromosome partitioning ATPase